MCFQLHLTDYLLGPKPCYSSLRATHFVRPMGERETSIESIETYLQTLHDDHDFNSNHGSNSLMNTIRTTDTRTERVFCSSRSSTTCIRQTPASRIEDNNYLCPNVNRRDVRTKKGYTLYTLEQIHVERSNSS